MSIDTLIANRCIPETIRQAGYPSLATQTENDLAELLAEIDKVRLERDNALLAYEPLSAPSSRGTTTDQVMQSVNWKYWRLPRRHWRRLPMPLRCKTCNTVLSIYESHDMVDCVDKLKQQRDATLCALQSIVDITEEARPPAPECYVREVAIQAIARHTLEEAGQ